MPAVFFLLGLLLQAGPEVEAPRPQSAPLYTAASIVNGADNQSGALAPNTIGTVYGKNLAYTTRALAPGDLHGAVLPTSLGDVIVLIGGLLADLYYVSPTQVNFLVPPNLLPGPTHVQLVVDSWAGPAIAMKLAAAAPALFQLDLHNAVATRADFSVITPAAPAHPGELVILYATGLGQTVPPAIYDELPGAAAPLSRLADFKVLLDGKAVDAHAVAYAGIAPGFAGLYQINLLLPSGTGADPEIRIGLGDALSIKGVRLPVSP